MDNQLPCSSVHSAEIYFQGSDIHPRIVPDNEILTGSGRRTSLDSLSHTGCKPYHSYILQLEAIKKIHLSLIQLSEWFRFVSQLSKYCCRLAMSLEELRRHILFQNIIKDRNIKDRKASFQTNVHLSFRNRSTVSTYSKSCVLMKCKTRLLHASIRRFTHSKWVIAAVL